MIVVDALRPMRQDPRVARLADLLKNAKTPVAADGLWGSAAPILAGLIAEATRRPLLLITAHTDDADEIRDDLETALGYAPDLLPALDQMPGDSPDQETLAERLRLCLRLLETNSDTAPPVIVAPILAMMQPVPSEIAVQRHCRPIRVGQTLKTDEFTSWLDEQGFVRCEQVEQPGDYAYRGGIVDVFAPGRDRPVRIELFGDDVDSIRLFDAGTQRSSQTIEAIRLPAPAIVDGWRRDAPHEETTSFLALAPADTLVVIVEPTETQEIGRTCLQRLGERAGLIQPDVLFERFNSFAQLHFSRFAAAADVRLDVGSLPQFEAKTEQAFDALAELSRECEVVVFCDNLGEQQRLRELLDQATEGVSRVSTAIGGLRRGFRWGDTAFVPNHELFHRARRRTLRRVAPARPIDSFFDLNPGDHVVHIAHGIGRFVGLKTLTRSDQTGEYLEIEFADGATVHTPVSQIHVVQKYIGAAKGKPVLSKVGGSAWKRARDRVADAVSDLAAELLALQARRATDEGIAYPSDTHWQAEFEDAFPYTETEDQLRALGEIKSDLTRPRPMDRLICGDVGFGKTELAIRAAFKVIEYGKQVAVLAPTTVLAEQHLVTFRERLADYPFTIESLSRFRTAADAKRILKAAHEGRVDILIGTHRILSKDVRFSDLGLVIIDEEQRFGVEAKERLKQVRSTVDVLMLSATPIPR
ncbi:MAG: DEAD/DEAH box helicase, partial [Phycisphaerales bacterium]|nr:DEAD/DEAH box helicase [Phycisphaerales bacterium]